MADQPTSPKAENEAPKPKVEAVGKFANDGSFMDKFKKMQEAKAKAEAEAKEKAEKEKAEQEEKQAAITAKRNALRVRPV